MYISESDLKRRILSGQIEILDEVLNTLRSDREKLLLGQAEFGGVSLVKYIQEYSKYRTTLAREKRELETGK